MWSILSRWSILWSVWDWWSVRDCRSILWLDIDSVVCFGSMVNSVVGTLIGFDLLSVLLMVWDGCPALPLFHLVNFSWIDYFSLSSFYSKTGCWIFLEIPQKNMLRLIITLPKFKHNILSLYLAIQLMVCTIIYGHAVQQHTIVSLKL